MKKIGLIMLLLFSLVAGCKTKKSHVEKYAKDSVSQNREISNIDYLAVATKEHNSILKVDSAWTTAIRLHNFTGVIFPSGKVEGKADSAEIKQSGQQSKSVHQTENTKDSTSAQISVDVESKTKVKQRNTVADKETKGIGVPWYLWLIVVGAIGYLFYIIYNRIKQKLKPY